MKDGLRFSYLELENFKSIEKRIVEIDGRSLLITGKNGQGKSSLIQALLSGIDPKIQASDPIKSGETKAMTKVKVAGVLNGKEEEYTIEMFYTPKNKKGRIVLTNANGDAVPSPKEMLKSIIGDISFDIFKFLNAPKAKQIDVLKELSGVRVEMDKLDMKRKEIFEERTFLNRKAGEDEAVMNNHGLSQDDIDLFSEMIDLTPIREDVNGVSKKIADWNGVKMKTEAFEHEYIETCPAKIAANLVAVEAKEKEINELKEKIKNLSVGIDNLLSENQYIVTDTIVTAKSSAEKGRAWLEKNPEPNATDVSNRLSAAMIHNQNCEKVTQLAEKQKGLREQKSKLEEMTAAIGNIDSKKDSLLKKSKLPIKGLTFDEDNIYLNGLPLEEGQINSAQLIDVGLEISMALNPNLKVVFLHEGSLFDKDALNALIKKVEERGYQLIAEIVSSDPDLQISFTEEEIE